MSVLSWNAVTGPVDINILCFANSGDHAFTIAGGGCGSLIKYRSLSREILRAGFKMLPKGQLEAARDFGFQRRKRCFIFRCRRCCAMMPALINETIDIIKNSALVSVVAVHELMRVTQTLASTTYRPLEFYTACGLLLFSDLVGAEYCWHRLEKTISSSAQRVLAQ